jgi:membrane protein DedA with SNARE-associated domain
MIGQDIINLFSSLGDIGMLLAILVIILIDGTAFPTLPEVWMVWIFGAHPESLVWAATLIVVASFASLAGNFTLFGLVRLVGLPNWIQKRMRQYTNFLLVHDERLLILNRIAPIIPYTGAFIAACNWNLRKCALYVLASALIKFTIIVLISWASFENLKQEVAPWVSLGFVAIFLVSSVIVSFIYKKRRIQRGEPARSQS